MNDPLEQILSEASARRRAAANSRLDFVPRMKAVPGPEDHASHELAEAEPLLTRDTAHDGLSGPHSGLVLSGRVESGQQAAPDEFASADDESPGAFDDMGATAGLSSSVAPAWGSTLLGKPAVAPGCKPSQLDEDADEMLTAQETDDPVAQSNGDAELVAIDLHKKYRKGPVEVPVLRGLGLNVRRGEFLAIVGQSGSGKSTLLHLLGTLDVPDTGEIHFQGRRIDNLSSAGRDALRNRQFGMIFQFYHLLPELTTLENVLAPLMITHSTLGFFRRRRQYRAAAVELLEMVGLGHRLKHLPRELSGGEMQRAAIARSLIARPSLLLADEPTGNLDQETGQEIIRILRNLNERQSLTIVMVTHDQAIADQADRIIRLADGRIAKP